jgi:hypothetical protein
MTSYETRKTNFIVFGIFSHGSVMPVFDIASGKGMITPEFQRSDGDNVYVINCSHFTHNAYLSKTNETELYHGIQAIFESQPTLDSLSTRQIKPTKPYVPGENVIGKSSSTSKSEIDIEKEREFDARLNQKIEEVVDFIKTQGTHWVDQLQSLDNYGKDTFQLERASGKVTKNELIPDKTYERDDNPNQHVPFGDIIVISTDNPHFPTGRENPGIWQHAPDNIPTLSFIIHLAKAIAKNVVICDFTCSSIYDSQRKRTSSRQWLSALEKTSSSSKAGGRKRKTRRKRIRKRGTRRKKIG